MTINLEKELLCFSHLRWDFVFQRPQHLMTRFAQNRNVYFWEEPFFDSQSGPYLEIDQKLTSLCRCIPHLPAGCSPEQIVGMIGKLLEVFLNERNTSNMVFWYYTPLAYEFSRSFTADLVVYDCMDELSAFKFAPPQLKYMEGQLLLRADLVFTGGHSLYEAKKHSHHNIHPFPSSIDKEHFQTARMAAKEPDDQACIHGIKLGFYGVVDERFDQELVRAIAHKRPDWHFVIIGPVVKIDPAELPRASNIHYLGCKSYEQLPAYLSGWDVALIPFLLNESTQFISPTKTPEYLSAGRPVVSSAIRDVVYPYSELGLVSIGKDPDTFISAIEYELKNRESNVWLSAVDSYLSDKSWQHTFNAMNRLMYAASKQHNPETQSDVLKTAS
jgi:glycosyltransferase involved in cell wall biosynthesis